MQKQIYRLASIPGDGVGREVVAATRDVVDAVVATVGAEVGVTWTEFPWGTDFYHETGRMMAEDGVDQLRGFDAIVFGAVGWPTAPDHVTLWGLRLAICQGLDQWANIRPAHRLPGVPIPLDDVRAGDFDFVIVRENSEGEYSGFGGRNFAGRPGLGELAVQSSVFTEYGCERIIRHAFELARTRVVKRVTSVTKSNAQQYGLVLWDDVFRRVAEEFPDVETESVLVDAMAARCVLDPGSLSVVVASNLFADILSDLGGALMGGLGVAPSANLNPGRATPSMFEPVHGSAYDIAGHGIANPVGSLLSASMMLDHLGHSELAQRLERAVAGTLEAGVRTPDIGGDDTTADVAKAVISRL